MSEKISAPPHILEFDDIVEDANGLWSTICQECVDRFSLDINDYVKLNPVAGNEICDIKGCQNEAKYYIDFKR